eukprot:6255761-Pyramimonas_sp.AAC.1
MGPLGPCAGPALRRPNSSAQRERVVVSTCAYPNPLSDDVARMLRLTPQRACPRGHNCKQSNHPPRVWS